MNLSKMEMELLNKTYPKDISIIIYNNNSTNLIKCLKKIKKQNYNFDRVEIIIETQKLEKGIYDNIKKISEDFVINEYSDLSVAKAYNNGLKESTGKYISFINSNIIYNSINIFKKIVNKDKKVLIANMYYKDETEDLTLEHIFNIEENRTVRMDISSGRIKTCLESVFIRREYIFDIEFDESFDKEAPLKFLIEILKLNKKYYASTIKITTLEPYEDNISKNAIQYNKEWYNESLEKWIKYAKEFDYIPLFIQEYLLYVIFAKYNCNLNDRNKNVLSEKDISLFYDNTSKLLKFINDRTILQYDTNIEYNFVKHIFKVPRHLRYFFYTLKNGDNNKKFMSSRKIYELIDDEPVCVLDLENEKINIYAINYKNGKLIFDCTLPAKDYLKENEINIEIYYGNNKIDTKKLGIYGKNKVFGKTYAEKYLFQFEIDINSNYDNLEAYIVYEEKRYQLQFNFIRMQSRLSNLENSYWKYKNFVIQNYLTYLKISKSNIFKVLLLESKFQFKKIDTTDNEEKKAIKQTKKLRLLYWLTRPFMYNKHIWITFDKLYKAGDNGEYIYQYGLKNNKNIYYIIKRESLDYERLYKFNKKHLLIFNSTRAKLYSLHAEVVLDTHANAASYCGFNGIETSIVSDLFNPNIICIQHGLTMQDIAQFQNRLFDNIRLYCCASKYEVENISKPLYGYNKEDIKLTGLARYDGLKSNDKRIILITPTWRKNIVNSNIVHHMKKHNDNFINSKYYKIYNNLINNKKLIKYAEEHNYRIIYLLHPAMSSQISDFDKNDYVDIIPATGEISYEKILTESSLMVTDYSGVQYDFAYQRKPLVYYHPKELPPHYDTGMMDYNKMGFGEICTTEQEIVDMLCSYMENDCKIKKEYKARSDEFFAFDDFNNCERIIKEIDNYLKDN